jgi:ATP-binding cassette subfamily F protein uup
MVVAEERLQHMPVGRHSVGPVILAHQLASLFQIARIEALFASPDFHRTHAGQTNQLKADLAATKERLAQLNARWEELEAIKAGSVVS